MIEKRQDLEGTATEPEGINVSLNDFWRQVRISRLTGSGNDFVEHMGNFTPLLTEIGFEVFESGVADLIQLEKTGRTTAKVVSGLLPIVFEWEVANILALDEWRQAGKKPKGLFGDGPLIKKRLKDLETDGKVGVVGRNADIIRALITGPDLDGRVDLKQEEIDSWADKQTELLADKLKVEPEIETEGEKTVRRLVLDEKVISIGARGQVTVLGLRSLAVPVLEIETGKWASGIRYVDLRLTARLPGEPVDYVMGSVGFTTKPELLSKELADKDTRTGLGIHSWNVPRAEINKNGEIKISSEVVRAFDEPIKLGKEFSKKEPEERLLEFMRIVRYSLRYGVEIVEDENFEQALEMIRNGADEVKGKIKPGEYQWWEVDFVKEAVVSLFYAPKEFIHWGQRMGLDRYMPGF